MSIRMVRNLRIEMIGLCFALSFLVLLLPGISHAQGADPIRLEAIHVLPVEGPEFNQPSGLFVHNDTLYTVSDKHDDTIFRIEIHPAKAVFVPHIRFEASSPSGLFGMDFEGITRDDSGDFYLVSEGAFAILKVSADGGKTSWISSSLREAGASAGLFHTRGGYLEGITRLGANRFLVSAERQPCGLIEVDTSSSQRIVEIANHGSSASYTGLHSEEGDVFILQRGSSTVRKTRRYMEPGNELEMWSFEHINHHPKYTYQHERFGANTAEGLAMDHDRVYIILDNNNDARRMYPSDRRPLLLILKRPS